MVESRVKSVNGYLASQDDWEDEFLDGGRNFDKIVDDSVFDQIGTSFDYKMNIDPNMKDAVRDSLSEFRDVRQHGGSHYQSMVVEPVDLAYLNDLDFCQTTIVKYVMRHKSKNGPEDIKKAIDICKKILEIEYGEEY